MGKVIRFDKSGNIVEAPAPKKPSAEAPYVEPDSKQLGDVYVSPQESVIRERDKALGQASAFKIHRQDELADPVRGSGAQLSYKEIIRRIQKLNPGIQVKDSSVKGVASVALYCKKCFDEYDESEKDPNKDEFFWHHKYVTGMPASTLAEYSYVELDTSLLPTKEIRGWRSILIALIQQGVITYQEAITEFGNPEHDQRSALWFEQLSQYRR